MKKIVVLIDGGYLRCAAKAALTPYNPDFIERVALACPAQDEEILRILYYDCAPYTGSARNPVSGTMREFHGSDHWLNDLSRRNLFAVRRGVLKFRGFKPRNIPMSSTALQDSDFVPDFEQKGVDMRIGLDIALYSQTKAVDRIVLISGDTDCVPAMKHGRKAGLQVVLIGLPGIALSAELLAHSDFQRPIQLPPAVAQPAPAA